MKNGNKALNVIKILYIVNLIISILWKSLPLFKINDQILYGWNYFYIFPIEAICIVGAVILLHYKMVIYALIGGVINIGIYGFLYSPMLWLYVIPSSYLYLGFYLNFVSFALLIAINLWLIKFRKIKGKRQLAKETKLKKLEQRIIDMELQEKGIAVSNATQEEVKIKKMLVFISYATKDAELFKIKEIAKALNFYEDIKEVLYWQKNMKDNIIKYMNDNLGRCNIMLLFCSPNALISIPVEKEWTAADSMGKPIIPIFLNPDHIPPLLKSRLGLEYDSFDFQKNIHNLHDLILKKCSGSLIHL
ncbi:hypothetical protein ES705_08712 [subsurface metagenome]